MSGVPTPSDSGGRDEKNARTLKSRLLAFKQAAPLLYVVGGLFLAILIAQRLSDRSDTSASDNSASDGAAPTQRWTKTEFIDLVAGKTKAQIRAEFGSPDSVQGPDWLYFHLPVYDKDAGTQANSTDITFGNGLTLMLQLFQRQCVDQDALAEDCANDVHIN